MTDYREHLSKLVLSSAMDPASEDSQSWVLDQLLGVVQIEIPPARLSSEIARLESYDSHLLQQEILESGDFSMLLPEKQQQRKQRLRQEAERELKADILLHYIAEKEVIGVTAEEREAEAQRIAADEHISLEEIRKFMGPSFEMLQEDLMLRKTLHWLTGFLNKD